MIESDSQLIAALKEIGLTEDEAIIYNLLVSLGTSTVGNISSLSSFSRTKIYAILDKLLAKEWIKIATTNPKTFMAQDPRQVLLNRKKSILSACDLTEKELGPIYDGSKQDMDFTSTYRGFSAFNKAIEMISAAENSVKIVTPFRPREITNKAIEMIKDARSRGVDIKIVTSKKLEKQFEDIPSVKTFKEDPSMKLDVRFRELPQVFMLITDECEVLFSSVKGEGITFIPQNIVGISTRDQELIKFCSLIFEYLFSISEE